MLGLRVSLLALCAASGAAYQPGSVTAGLLTQRIASRATPVEIAPTAKRVARHPQCNIAEPPAGTELSEEAAKAAAAAKAARRDDYPALFRIIENALEAATGDPKALLEAVVGIDRGVATYDRDGIVDYFTARPQLMVARALDFLLAFRRIRAVWDNPSPGVDRGATLRSELSALGPVAVKVGQTLSQRPDILPEDVCEALKGLQTSNTPFPNEEAYRVIAEDFNATGPIAPGLPLLDGYDPNGPTLFKALTKDCIASASLGQVYRGTTHEGLEIAVKVQRPSALRQCLLDGSVIIVALKAITGRFWNGDLLAIFDLVASGIVQELDFRNEAANAKAFKESLSFLGYVDVPVTLPELTTRRAMAMEWVYGRHLSALNPEEAMRMTYMSCEAVTAGLVLTGLVHADPHEGNIMLADDGRLIFLDFGLMSSVESDIQEAFASGIQCVLSKDYYNLVKAFVDTGFIGNPIEWRPKEADPWQTTHPDGDDLVEIMAKELKERMEACPGGGSRFGALSIVLGDMGYFWQMYTPPYIILLIRTFLTLEGIAGQVDPSFNIYEVALPWAVQRALSPSTTSARQTLRNSLLAEDNTFQWDRVETLMEQQRADEAEAKAKAEADAAADAAGADGSADAAVPEAASARARLMSQEANKAELDPVLAAAGADAQAAQAATPLDSLTTVLGSKSGGTLRRIARDVDSTTLLLELAGPAARPYRRLAVQKLSEGMRSGIKELAESVSVSLGKGASAADSAKAIAPQEWPDSPTSLRLQKRANTRAKKTGILLLKTHVDRQIANGWRGAAAVGALAYVTLRVGVAALARTIVRTAGASVSALLPKKAAAALAAAAASLFACVGRELSAVGGSATNIADDIKLRRLAMLAEEESDADGEGGDAPPTPATA